MAIISTNRIAEARIAAGLSQQQLADAMGVHWVTVSKLERGKIKLTLDRMAQIAPLLNVEPGDLMPGQKESEVAPPEDGPRARLKRAREAAGFATASAAARNFGWNENTYRSHENGERGLGFEEIELYASTFGVTPSWLAFGDGFGLKRLEQNQAEDLSALQTIGARIAALRKMRGITQDALAKTCNVAQSSVDRWERLNAVPSADIVPDLAEALQVNILTLFGMGDGTHQPANRPQRRGPAHDEAAKLIGKGATLPETARARARDAIIALSERLKIEAAQGLG